MTPDRLPWHSLAGAALAFTLAACVPVTININFPQEKIDSAAANIEGLVRAPKDAPGGPADPAAPTTPAPQPTPGKRSDAPTPARPVVASPQRTWSGPWLASLTERVTRATPSLASVTAWLTPAAEAQVPELKTRTPEVMAVIESRRARFPAISKAMAAGCLGETSQGLLEPRPGAGCGADTASLAAAENKDRMTLYQTLVAQNQMPPGDIARVQQAFAKSHRDHAPAGAWVQNDAGQWTRK
jgi:uncharacterized protein YdbL (DUF1318 family)